MKDPFKQYVCLRSCVCVSENITIILLVRNHLHGNYKLDEKLLKLTSFINANYIKTNSSVIKKIKFFTMQ